MTLIPKNHFALNRTDYMRGLLEGRYKNQWPDNLHLQEIETTKGNLNALQGKMDKWHWSSQDRYNDGSLEKKLKHQETALYKLMDNNVSPTNPIGYTFVTAPHPSIKKRFWDASTYPVIEIENLGLFDGYEGGGRGKAYFEMLFARYFKDYETVYWSQHEIHSPTLKRFYLEKIGMALLGTDHVADFRPKQKPRVA